MATKKKVTAKKAKVTAASNVKSLQAAGVLPKKHDLDTNHVKLVENLTATEIKGLIGAHKKLGLKRDYGLRDAIQSTNY